MKDLGLPVVTLRQFSSLEGIEENIRIVGRAVGEAEKAEALISEMQQRLETLGAQLPKKSARPVLLSYDVSGWTAGSETTFDAVFDLCGERASGRDFGHNTAFVRHCHWDFIGRGRSLGTHTGRARRAAPGCLDLPHWCSVLSVFASKR